MLFGTPRSLSLQNCPSSCLVVSVCSTIPLPQGRPGCDYAEFLSSPPNSGQHREWACDRSNAKWSPSPGWLQRHWKDYEITFCVFQVEPINIYMLNIMESQIPHCWKRKLQIWKWEEKNVSCGLRSELEVSVWTHSFYFIF